MNTIENKVIIYDDVCPLCNAYTGCFIKIGWLRHRTGFGSADPALLEKIDLNRARHEIPLYDTTTGQTLYGLDALFYILGTHAPVFKPLFRNRIFRAFWKQVYQIITYNRRIIAGSRAPERGFDCAPDINLFYRWLYIGLAFGAAALLQWANWPENGAVWHFTILFLQVLALFSGLFFSTDRLTFLGHWATISLVIGISTVLWQVHPLAVVVSFVLAGLLWCKRWALAFARSIRPALTA